MPNLRSPHAEESEFALRSLGWCAGLPLLVILWAGATYGLDPIVSDTLLASSRDVVTTAGRDDPGLEPWLRLQPRGRDLVARGEAPDAARHDLALTQLEAVPGLRRVIDETGLVLDASPFVWQARSVDAGKLRLSGHRPHEIGATQIEARLTGRPAGASFILDQTHAARGGPPNFMSAATFAVRALALLDPGAEATLTDTVLSFEGEARNLENDDAFRAAIASPPDGFTVGPTRITPPAVAEFRFAVTRSADGHVQMDGFAESEPARQAILVAANEAAAGSAVEDRLRIARGRMNGIDALALSRFAIGIAGLIKDGKVAFEKDHVSVTGRAIDTQAVGEIEKAMQETRPAGVRAGSLSVTAAAIVPYTLRMRRDGAAVLVSGHVPDAKTKDRVLAQLRARFVSTTIVDRSRIAAGAPDGLVDAAGAVIYPLSTLAEGEAELADKTLHLTGVSLYEESADRLRSTVPAALPTGWNATLSITVKDAPQPYDTSTCGQQFAERVGRSSLRFAPGSSELKADFYPVLDAVAELAIRCVSQRVEIAGYADPSGTPPHVDALPEYTASLKPADKSKTTKPEKKTTAKTVKPEAKPAGAPREPAPDLAQQRASTVVDYLLKAGVPRDRALAIPNTAPDRSSLGIALRS